MSPEVVLAPLDAARGRVLRLGVRAGAGFLVSRERRVPVVVALSVLSSLALTVVAPVELLALGPLVLGVPHLVADVRYLVVGGPRLSGTWWGWLTLAPVAAVAAGAPSATGVLAVLGPLALPGGRFRGPVLLAGLALFTAAALEPGAFLVWFAHAHNVVAVVVWLVLRRAATGAAPPWASLGLIAAASLLLLSGAVDGLIAWTPLLVPLTLSDFTATLAPVGDGTLAAHLVLAFAFLQSLHHGLWLRVIPDEVRARPAPRTFVASYRALVGELGPAMVPLAALATAGFMVWGAFDVPAARDGYLRLAAFHGYLELGALAALLVHRRR